MQKFKLEFHEPSACSAFGGQLIRFRQLNAITCYNVLVPPLIYSLSKKNYFNVYELASFFDAKYFSRKTIFTKVIHNKVVLV